MIPKPDRANPAAGARFRFSVVGSLLSSPPARGDPKTALQTLARRPGRIRRPDARSSSRVGTIERWYYTARRERDDPVGVLQRAVRKDRGKVTLAATLAVVHEKAPKLLQALQHDRRPLHDPWHRLTLPGSRAPPATISLAASPRAARPVPRSGARAPCDFRDFLLISPSFRKAKTRFAKLQLELFVQNNLLARE